MKVAGYGRGHTHACVSLDGVGTDRCLHQLILDPLGFHSQLAGAVEPHRVAAFSLNNLGYLVSDHLLSLFVSHFIKDTVVEATLGLGDVAAQWIAHILSYQHFRQSVDINRLVCI